ncbi:MAG: BolA family transcriptional regulator [Alphaproteobacteria bacterium]|nr:BolA family transcriptional regulator [Alphaproteobacteria bacterium]
MTVAERIEAKLRARFAPARLVVLDESARHAGHAGARPEGETHFRLEVVAAAFDGLARIARQRLVHEALAEELAGPVHALAMTLRTPSEDGGAIDA